MMPVAVRPALMLLCLLPVAWPAAAQLRCPPPRYTVETLKARVLELGAVEDASRRIQGLVEWALSTSDDRCSILEGAVDRQELAEGLIGLIAARRAVPRGFPWDVFSGIRLALSDPSSELVLPMEALSEAVERGVTPAARGGALALMQRSAENPETFQYLLAWARAPVGPPAWPALPERIVQGAYVFGFGTMNEVEAFRDALEAEPDRILNPRVRCWVENPVFWATEAPPPRPCGEFGYR